MAYLKTYLSKYRAGVPEMTSNNTPYGECGGTSLPDINSNYYKAFDGNMSSSCSVQATNGIWRIFYKFNQPTNVRRFLFAPSTNSDATPHLLAFNFKIQGSNDGVNWTDLYSKSVTQAEHQSYQLNPLADNIENDDNYLYYCISSTAPNYDYDNRLIVGTLQFYARKLYEYI